MCDADARLTRLAAVMAALRTPHTGCPWDLEQNFATIAPYTIEEAYEVADAIARGDLADLKEELGDLLLQAVYHARLAEEQSAFTLNDVIEGVTAKMIRRHPHVFGDDAARSAGAAKGFWEKIKAEERLAKAAERARFDGGAAKAHAAAPASALDDVPVGLPGLTRAIKLQAKAAKVGFDWPSIQPVLDKVREEIAELEMELISAGLTAEPRSHQPPTPNPSPRRVEDLPSAIRGGGSHRVLGNNRETNAAQSPSPLVVEGWGGGHGADALSDPSLAKSRIFDEYGDLLFVMANLARHLDIDPEAALRAANQKFTRRFHGVEALLRLRGKTPAQSDLAEMDALWDAVKRAEKA